LRNDLGHVGLLRDVVAPPYDVIGPELQDALYKKHPANVIRLILNREEPGDDDHNNRYVRAARFLRNWKLEGLLQTDPDPAVYVYHQVFEYGGQAFTRRGFMARVRLERFGEGSIYPHEETHAKAKADRLLLTRACRANLSQIFGIYPDPDDESQSILENAIQGVIPLEASDHLGVVHRLWPVSNVKTISELAATMSPRPLFIADGHHRYETACNYRDHLAEAGAGELDTDHPANYVMMMCVGIHDPGMIVLPTHRLFRGLPAISVEQLTDRLGDCFDTEAAGCGADRASEVWSVIEQEQQQGSIGFHTHVDGQWTIARLNETGREKMVEVAPNHSSEWRSLGVSVLHRLAMDNLLEAADLPKPDYVHLVQEVEEDLKKGDAAGEPYSLAALVMPATLDHIRSISHLGERMPAKSTYFYPKLLSGFVINPLE
ncbi:MAG: DUF1015 domain-containing protein, partial [Pirellulaceae bacterium]